MPNELDREAIQTIITGTRRRHDTRIMYPPIRTEAIEACADQISIEYARHITRNPQIQKGFLTALGTDQREHDYAFLDAVEAYTPKGTEGKMEQAIRSHELMILHYLIVNQGIERLYESYIRELGDNAPEATLADEDATKAMLAEEFIANKIRQSKETRLIELHPDAPTTGFELEYYDIRSQIIWEVAYAQLLADYGHAVQEKEVKKAEVLKELLITQFGPSDMVEELAHCSDEQVESFVKFADARRTKITAITVLPYSIPISDQPENPEEPANYPKTVREKTAERLTIETRKVYDALIRAYEITRNEALLWPIESLEQRLRLLEGSGEIKAGTQVDVNLLATFQALTPTTSKRLEELGTHKDKEVQKPQRECVSMPAVSVRVPLRNITYAAREGAFGDALSMHQTIAGVELSPEHTNIMEARSMLTAAGMTGKHDKTTQALLTKDDIVTSEAYIKLSPGNDGSKIYYPFHSVKTADSESFVPYPTESPRDLVEFRSFSEFLLDDDYPTFVKSATFIWMCSWVEQAAQKSPEMRSEEDEKLATLWENTLKKWSALLKEKSIYQPQGHERYTEVILVDDAIEIVGEMGRYQEYLTDIENTRHSESTDASYPREETLKHKTRMLMIEFRKGFREIIDY